MFFYFRPQQFQLLELVAYLYHMMYRSFRPRTVPEPLFRFVTIASFTYTMEPRYNRQHWDQQTCPFNEDIFC